MQEIQKEFPHIQIVSQIKVASGQKDVFISKLAGKDVVLKIIKNYNSSEARVEREIAAVSKLNSAYVPAVLEHGKKKIDGEERYYLVEPYLQGNNYKQVLSGKPQQPILEVLELTGALLKAVVDFEKARLVHRDIKPDNLIVDNVGKIWIIDFGLVRHLDLESVTPSGMGHGVGTLGYAPPEQFRNLKRELDSRADIYSVGVVSYEALIGSNPHVRAPNDILTVLRRMTNEDLPVLQIVGDNDGKLAEFFGAITSRFPSRRPRTAGEALNWFESIAGKFGYRGIGTYRI